MSPFAAALEESSEHSLARLPNSSGLAAACACNWFARSNLLTAINRARTASPYIVSNSLIFSSGVTWSRSPANFRRASAGQMMLRVLAGRDALFLLQ